MINEFVVFLLWLSEYIIFIQLRVIRAKSIGLKGSKPVIYLCALGKAA